MWGIENDYRAAWSDSYWSRNPTFRGEGSVTNQQPPESVIHQS